jgi:hypothetical protein
MNGCARDCRPESLTYTVISRIIGIVVFLILVVVLNILLRQITSPFFHAFVIFVNANIWLVLLFSLLFMFADIFRAVFFPLNLPYPLIASFGSVFFIMFFFRFLEFLDIQLALGFFPYIDWTYYLIAPLVFFIALICGYVSVFRKVFCPRRAKGEPCPAIMVGTPVETGGQEGAPVQGPAAGTLPGESKSWEDIAAEFRELVYDSIHAIRMAVSQKK